jgi:hypothetical protein
MLKVRVAVATERTETKATIEERMMDRMMIRKGLSGKFVKVQSGISMSVYERTAGQRDHEYILTAHAQHIHLHHILKFIHSRDYRKSHRKLRNDL